VGHRHRADHGGHRDAALLRIHRYRGLGLLLQAGGRLFLVPTYWNAQGRTLVVPYDDSIRIQVIPQPAGARG